MASVRRRKESTHSNGQKISLLIRKILRKIAKYTYWTRDYLVLEGPLQPWDRPLPDNYTLVCSDDPLFSSTVTSQLVEGRELWEKRLEQGLICHALLRGGKLIGWSWFTTKDYFEPDDRFTIRLEPHQVYSFHLFLEPEERAAFLAVQAVRKMQNYYFTKGYTRLVACVDKELRRNLHFHRLLRLKETGRKIHVRYFFTWPVSTVQTYAERYMKPRG